MLLSEEIFLPTIADGEDKSSILKNRIRKNYRHVRKWAKRTHTNAFRIYDRDIKEYPLAIDYYDGRFCVHYFTSSRDNDEPREDLVEAAGEAISSIFGADPSSIYSRTRKKREKTEQYEKVGEKSEFFPVYEYGVKFWINLQDYLDTGLFLDHRETRKFVASIAKGKRLLNLFAYTGSFSVQAAFHGALFTKTVDMSNTYIHWAKENFLLNSIAMDNHEIVRADCLKFLDEEIRSSARYDIIVIDPPTLSRSKKMEDFFDIQEDYATLIGKALKLLLPRGEIFFSTNSRKFVFDTTLFPNCLITEMTEKTLPIDFHDKKIHRLWKLQLK